MPEEASKAPEIKVVVAIDDLSKKDAITRILTDEIGYNESEIDFVDPSILEDEIMVNRIKVDLLILSGTNRSRILKILSGNGEDRQSDISIITEDSITKGTAEIGSDSDDAEALAKIQELLKNNADKQIQITSDADKPFCFYDDINKMPSLLRGNENTRSLRDRLVALFDVDGTLAQAFVMGRFAEFLSKNSVFDNLLRNIPSENRSKNKEALQRLLNITEFLSATAYREEMAKKGKYKAIATMGYEELIRHLNDMYAQMLKGLSVAEVCKLGHEFSRIDVATPNIIMPYSVPVIDLVKKCGMMPTLLTGMPAETLGGYRESLGIRERCYPLELTTSGYGSERKYLGGVAYSGGLATDKSTTARQISANGNEIMFYMGDQVSDIPPMHEAMKEHDGVFGLGYLMHEPTSTDGMRLQSEIHRAQTDYVNRGQLTMLGKNLNPYVILKKITQDLYWMTRMRAELGEGKKHHVSHDTMVKYIEYLMQAPLARIKELYKK